MADHFLDIFCMHAGLCIVRSERGKQNYPASTHIYANCCAIRDFYLECDSSAHRDIYSQRIKNSK